MTAHRQLRPVAEHPSAAPASSPGPQGDGNGESRETLERLEARLAGLERALAELHAARIAAEQRLTRLESMVPGIEGQNGGVHAANPAAPGTDAVAFEDFPEEISTAVAAKILGVGPDAVRKLLKSGALRYRNTSAPGSTKPTYRYLLDDVLTLRRTYQQDEPVASAAQTRPRRRPRRTSREYRHLDPRDD